MPVASMFVMESPVNPEALADRLREVRRQLSRHGSLVNLVGRQQQSQATLRAAQRLEAAVRQLETLQQTDDTHPETIANRVAARKAQAGLPWLVRVVEERARLLEQSLLD